MPNTTYPQEIEIINHFVARLESRLAGREEPVLINQLPIDECHLGVLAPWRSPEDTEQRDIDSEENPGQDMAPAQPAAVKTRDQTGPSHQTAKGSQPAVDRLEEGAEPQIVIERIDDQDVPRRPASALGCELMLLPVKGRIKLKLSLSFAFYTTHIPTYEEQVRSIGGEYKAEEVAADPSQPDSAASSAKGRKNSAMTLAFVMRRQSVKVDDLVFDLDAQTMNERSDSGKIQEALSQAIDKALLDRPAPAGTVATRAGPPLRAQDLKDKAAFEAAIRDVAARAKKDPCRHDPQLRAALRVRVEPQASGKVRVSLYLSNETERNEELRTQDNVNILADARLWGDVTTGELAPIEILPIPRDYQYDRRVWGVGHNTSVNVDQATGHFETHALARFDQPRLTTKDHLPTEFERFDKDTFAALKEVHAAMQAEVTHWRDDILGKNELGLGQEELKECEADFENFSREVERFAAGIAALKAQPELLRAFQAMNRVMGRIAALKGFQRWRLFQIAFIVTQLPALALRENVEGAEDHLEQQHSWGDDLDIADVLWFPTGGGKTEAYLGLICCAMLYDRLRGKTMGVTAWLRFPLRMLSVQQLQRAVTMIYEAQVELNSLAIDGDKDPLLLGYFVGNSTTPNSPNEQFFKDHTTPASLERYKMIADCPKCKGSGTVDLIPKADRMRLYHICRDPKCKYVLPVVITDMEIYRTLPALIVGTVDKAATLGMQEKFGILWSGPRWKCDVHGYGNTDFCVYGCKKKPQDIAKLPRINPKDPAPTLHLQDELHLLQEELGAFAGHYETLIRYCESQVPGSKKAKVIAATATIEGFDHQARHLYGVKQARRFPNRGYRRHENFYAQIEGTEAPGQEGMSEDKVARVFVAFRPNGLPTEAAARCTRILNETVAELFQREASSLASLKETTTKEQLASLRHYYSMTLTYVASLTGGTRVKDFLNDAGGQILNGQRDLGVRYLNGRSATGEIAGVIDEIESPEDWKSNQYVDALVATNVISHGVDLERCNLMVMEKYPAETSEYIQASSRSGRKKVGLVVVVLPVRNLRASSIYSRFKEYHQHLDRMVTPVPVNRFAKQALARTLTGTVAGLIYGIGVTRQEGQRLKDVKKALEWLDRPVSEGSKDLIISQHLRGAQALDQGNYEPELEQAQAELMKQIYGEVRERLGLHTNTAGKQTLGEALSPKPMTSLRDVERTVGFRPDRVDYNVLDWFEKSTK